MYYLFKSLDHDAAHFNAWIQRSGSNFKLFIVPSFFTYFKRTTDFYPLGLESHKIKMAINEPVTIITYSFNFQLLN